MIEAMERGGRIRADDVKVAVNWFPSRHGCVPQHFLGGDREISKFEALERNSKILCHRKDGYGEGTQFKLIFGKHFSMENVNIYEIRQNSKRFQCACSLFSSSRDQLESRLLHQDPTPPPLSFLYIIWKQG